MTHIPFLFNQTIEQMRRIGARGGKAHAHNWQARQRAAGAGPRANPHADRAAAGESHLLRRTLAVRAGIGRQLRLEETRVTTSQPTPGDLGIPTASSISGRHPSRRKSWSQTMPGKLPVWWPGSESNRRRQPLERKINHLQAGR
jgi:hypothetical protein